MTDLAYLDTHSAECLMYYAIAERERQEWFELHPDACQSCDGWGGYHISGTYWEPPDFQECGDCLAAGKCPMCGADAGDRSLDSDEPCLNCGYTVDTETSGAPGPWECYGECKHEDEAA